uniref:Uncharacterized protein n=1 Tax=Panagrolaimus sp. ES5 TaxID=591445 RepID=A0AC34F1W3_9BILA
MASIFVTPYLSSKKKDDKPAKALQITKDEDSEEEKRGKKKDSKGKGKNAAATKKGGKKGKGEKTETEITEDPDLKSRDDYGVKTNDESMKHLKK